MMADTSHRGNIFCAELQPYNESKVISCAADGVLLLNDVNIPRNNSKHLMTTPLLMHMFAFDIEQPNILYTAEECGAVSRVDLRVNSNQVEKIFSNKRRGMISAVKTVTQSSFLGSNFLFVGGEGHYIDLHDLRLLSNVNKEYKSSFINQNGHIHTSAVKVFTPLRSQVFGSSSSTCSDTTTSSSYSYNHKHPAVKSMISASEVSVSGMQGEICCLYTSYISY